MRVGPAVATHRFAAEVGPNDPVAAEGSRTRWGAGGVLDSGARVIRAPSGILEHRPEEMIVRVLAGTKVSELHDALASRNQRTSLPDRGGTIGGALAVAENDLSVLGRGRVRDVLLQLCYVSATGEVVTGGAPTVKNVSGFDLPRLFVGSLGTLGLIAEVVLRTNPTPPASCWLRASANPFAVQALIARPSALLWDGDSTWVHLEGYEADIDAQRRVLTRIAHWTEVGGSPSLPGYRWSLEPAQLRNLDEVETGTFVASIGVGTVFASRPQPSRRTPAAEIDLASRVKAEFDPTGRLNPGRNVLRRDKWI